MLKEIAGTRAYNILKKRKMETVEDVCQLFPSKYYDFSFINPLNTSRLDKNYAFVCKLVSYELKKQSSIYIVRCTLQDIYTQNELCVSWFGTTEMYNVLKKDYRPGDTCFIGGKLKASNKKNLFFMSNPIIFKKYDEESDCHIYTAYEKIRGISESNFERIINDCLEHATIPDKVPRELLHKYNLIPKDEAIREMHKPSSVEQIKRAKYRLNMDDLLYFALQLEEKNRNLPAGSVYGIHSLATTTKIIENLPFQLTKDQKSAYEELVNRIRSGKRLNALIQGDVGCGKTILAFLLMFVMADNGFQSVLLAPTQVLASQHYNELKEMAAPYDIDVVYIANGLKKKEREAILKSIEDGSALMIVGTHSVLSKEVKFHDLGLSITDEEHRFGVLQREEITTKAKAEFVLNRIKAKHAEGIPYNDICVLYRNSFQSYELEVLLNKAGLDFEKYGGIRFLDRAHIKDVLAFLRIYTNPSDELAWFRILQLHIGIGKVYARNISRKCLEYGPEYLIDDCHKRKKYGVHIRKLYDEIQSWEGKEFLEILKSSCAYYAKTLENAIRNKKVDSESDREESLQDLEKNKEDIAILQEMAKDYDSALAFLDATTLDAAKSKENEEDKLVLSTIHSVKGLEYDTVILLDCIDEILPSARYIGSPEDNEDVRCMYVAVTRAKNTLYMMVPKIALKYGKAIPGDLSRYIEGRDDLYDAYEIKYQS